MHRHWVALLYRQTSPFGSHMPEGGRSGQSALVAPPTPETPPVWPPEPPPPSPEAPPSPEPPFDEPPLDEPESPLVPASPPTESVPPVAPVPLNPPVELPPVGDVPAIPPVATVPPPPLGAPPAPELAPPLDDSPASPSPLPLLENFDPPPQLKTRSTPSENDARITVVERRAERAIPFPDMTFELSAAQVRSQGTADFSRESRYQVTVFRTLTGSPENAGTLARPNARSTHALSVASPNPLTSDTDCTPPDGANVTVTIPSCGPLSHDVAPAAARRTALVISVRDGWAGSSRGGEGSASAIVRFGVGPSRLTFVARGDRVACRLSVELSRRSSVEVRPWSSVDVSRLRSKEDSRRDPCCSGSASTEIRGVAGDDASDADARIGLESSAGAAVVQSGAAAKARCASTFVS